MNINKIKLSGTTYSIQDENATKTVELTQAQYDALPATAKTSNTLFIITDATAGDLSNYYTKSETSGATEISTALASKADTATTYTKTETDNAITAATSTKQDALVSGTNIKTINNQSLLGDGNIVIQGGGGGVNVVQTTGTSTADVMSQDAVTTAINDLEETLAAKINIKQGILTAGNGITIEEDVISVTGKVDTSTYNTYTAATDTALASKQTTLTAGTNITIVDNVISATGGGGGGKAVSGGTNISITTGETADTINCTLPMKAEVNNTSIYFGTDNWGSASGGRNLRIGYNANALNEDAICLSTNSTTRGLSSSIVGGRNHYIYNSFSFIGGGYMAKLYNEFEASVGGQYNNSVSASTTFGDSGNTLFSVGNGASNSARHNAFEIRQNGDIYITKDGQDVKLQDQLGGGGGSSYTAGDGIDITNDVISVTGKVDTSTYNTYTAATDTALGNKQDTLVSGTNIKTINNQSILGEGNITIQGGGGSITIDPNLDSGSTNPVANSAITNAIANATNGTLKEDLVFSTTCGYGTIESNVGSIDGEYLRINIYPAKTLQFNQYRSFGKNYYYKCFVLDIETKTEYKAYWNVTYNGITSSGGDGINYVTLNLPSGNAEFTVIDDTKYRIIGFERDIHGSSRESYSMESTYEVNIPSGTTTNELFQYIENVNKTKNTIGLTFSNSYGLRSQNFTDRTGGIMYYHQTVFPLNTSFTAHTANTTIHVTSTQTTAWDAKLDSSAITTSISSSSTDAQVPSAKAVYDALGNIETLLSQI